MSIAKHHAEWINLLEISGPFLSIPVLQEVFPQGLEEHSPERSRNLRLAYDEWDKDIHSPKPDTAKHAQWIEFVLRETLEFSEEVLREGQSIPSGLEAVIPNYGERLRPDWVVVSPREQSKEGTPQLLVKMYPPQQDLDKPAIGSPWKETPATRMMVLLHETNVPLGLITNGECWMLVYAPVNETTGFASWLAHLWIEEPITLRAFYCLLSLRRFFGVPGDQTLEKLFERSAQDQETVANTLGYQVRRSVEMLVQALDKADRDRKRELLAGVSETELYNAALTVMMRLVFLFSAEERELLLLGNRIYDQHYAVSTLCDQLRAMADKHGEEILEHRQGAWCRLLATFRAVHGGVQHPDLLSPPYGGHLFDPDRYPFLEGRKPGSDWRIDLAKPLPINNRAVLHLLESLQYLEVNVGRGGGKEKRRLSFRELGIEQIGHVYEGLLDHTAKRAAEPYVSLIGKGGDEPEIAVSELEGRFHRGKEDFIAWLHKITGRTANALARCLESKPDERRLQRLRAACETDELFQRIRPLAGVVRDDDLGYPVVFPEGSLFVTTGADRRSTGTHYTPPSLTEPIVQHTLEPIFYPDIPDGKSLQESRRLSVREVLDLKICDMAMGSGAFLVQTCRFLAKYIVQEWADAEKEAQKQGQSIQLTVPYAGKSVGEVEERLIPSDETERLILAQRLTAEKCLYGVDINPMAVEMAKLSLWLTTMDRNRPFTFLDHSLKCGDSLLGAYRKLQIDYIHIAPETFLEHIKKGEQAYLWYSTDAARDAFAIAQNKRNTLEAYTVNDIEDQQRKDVLLREANIAADLVRLVGDLLIGASISTADGNTAKRNGIPHEDFFNERRHIHDHLEHVLMNRDDPNDELNIHTLRRMAGELLYLNAGGIKNIRRPFHWPVEFPEIFLRKNGGFDAIVGNPPFMGGQKITGQLGTDYRNFCVDFLARGQRGSADLCAYFFLRAGQILRPGGQFGLLATNTIAQGDTREVGLEQLVQGGIDLLRAVPSRKWPGDASLEVAHVWGRKGNWGNQYILDDKPQPGITAFLTKTGGVTGTPYRLAANANQSFQGSIVLGMGFVMLPEVAQALIDKNPQNKDILFPYLNGEDLNSRPDQSPSRWVINFFDWPLDRTAEGSWEKGSEEQQKEWLKSGMVPNDYPEPVAADYPDCLSIIEEKVKPERTRKNENGEYALRKPLPQKWWIYAEKRPALYSTIAGMERVLGLSLVNNHLGIGIISPNIVFAHKLCVFCFFEKTFFILLQSNFHYHWAWYYSSTMRNDINYSPSDCFETFPFPEETKQLEDIGECYYNHRQQIMLARQEGLTTTYNRFHNPKEKSEDIQKLRELHVEMDYAVAHAYGWNDLDLGHGFHETKQGVRYTICEPARQEVLDRLLALNHQRYAEEVKLGLHDKKLGKKTTAARKKSKLPKDEFPLFDNEET